MVPRCMPVLGQLPIDMTATGADFIAATGRKFLRGPRGTGFLAVSQRALDKLEPVPIDMFGTTWDGEHGYELSPTASRYQSFGRPSRDSSGSVWQSTTRSRSGCRTFVIASMPSLRHCGETR